MSSFTGNPQDLAEKITYELEALEFLRRELFDHSEKPNGSMNITLGDLAENGNLRSTVNVVISENISASAVGTALSRLKPLAFSACFKLHDMMVEWILRANECTDWQFKKKISAYNKLKNSNTLIEPDLFVQRGEISEVFWGLYQSLVNFRNPIAHSGGTRINADGAIEIERHESVLTLTHGELGSYIRGMSIIANHYIGSISIDPHLAHLLNFDLSALKKHHNVALPNTRTPILTKLNLEIPADKLESITPIKATIDFGMLRQRMVQTYSSDDPSRLFYSTHVRASTAVDRAAWLFPIQTTPFGVVTLTVGDEEFDKYLVDF
jgi:hypothetical protein